MAVPVIVQKRAPSSPSRWTFLPQTSWFGHVSERTVAVVSVKSVCGFRGIYLQTRTRQQEDVHPAIVVVVDKSASATVGFEDVFLAFNSAVDSGGPQTSRFRDVGKMCVERPPRRRRSRLRFYITGRDALLAQCPVGGRI